MVIDPVIVVILNVIRANELGRKELLDSVAGLDESQRVEGWYGPEE